MSERDIGQMYADLKVAHEAGDKQLAGAIADRIRERSAPAAAEPSLMDRAVAREDVNYNPMVGSAEGALSLGSGMLGTVAGGIAGLGQAATNAAGLTSTPAGDRVRQIQQAVTYQPRTAAGRLGSDIVSYLPEKAAEFGDFAGRSVTDEVTNRGGSPERAAGAGTLLNTLIQAVPAAAGRVAGSKGAPRAAPAAAPIDEGIAAARANNLVITPTQANAGFIPRTIEGLSGSARLEKLASKKNAPTINNLIERDMGLAEDLQPAAKRQAIADARETAGQKYEVAKEAAGEWKPDLKFLAELDDIEKPYKASAKTFKHRQNNPIQETLDGLRAETIDGASLVEEVRNLRRDADKAYTAKDGVLGKSYKRAAQALDDMLERRLQQLAESGDEKAASAFHEYKVGRSIIAKTYAADKALNEASGNFNAGVYAREIEKGKKLTGGARDVGMFAKQFEKSAKLPEKGGNIDASFADALVAAAGTIGGAVAHGAVGGGAALPLLFARPAARHGLLSGFAQDSLTRQSKYGRPITGRLAELLQEGDYPAGAAFAGAGQRR